MFWSTRHSVRSVYCKCQSVANEIQRVDLHLLPDQLILAVESPHNTFNLPPLQNRGYSWGSPRPEFGIYGRKTAHEHIKRVGLLDGEQVLNLSNKREAGTGLNLYKYISGGYCDGTETLLEDRYNVVNMRINDHGRGSPHDMRHYHDVRSDGQRL